MNAQLHAQMEKEINKHQPLFLYDGNFTICLLLRANEDVQSNTPFGIAKCNPNCDEFNIERGHEIALARAVKKIVKKAVDKKTNGKSNNRRRK